MRSTHPALSLLLFGAVGCSGYRVAYVDPPPVSVEAPPPAGWGKVCVLRDSLVGGALVTPVRDNGEVVGATDGSGHFCYLASPGRHTLTVEVSDAAPLELEVAAGDRHYVEHAIRVGTDALVVVDAATAWAMARDTGYAVVTAAPEGAPLPAAVPRASGHHLP